ncbi:TrlF family AAA-like ATPase [Corynebacterium casei]|uniref:TrlF family AAA-like ATPase n=1 Tax=Corynebacterium casei TaxID=160386 RepID=UPI003FD0505E
MGQQTNTVRTRGAEWKKWDLHVHAPTTRLENGYTKKANGEPDWDRFCRIIHESDVAAIGITDYFSLGSFFEFKERYYALYPKDDSKVFFPNLELRLHYAVHNGGKEINIHLILPPYLDEEQADTLLRELKLFNESFHDKVPKNDTCYSARNWSKTQLKAASVTLGAIREAIKETFGGADLTNLENYALIVASGRDDGLSPGQGMAPRKEAAIDIVDNSIHAVFSRAKDASYWLSTKRIATEAGSIPKPTFGGCDAHDFDGLEKMLGKTGQNGVRHWETTWVKADLSWGGLLQTLAEPESRVRISELKPDTKDAYRIIDSVEFSDETVFPTPVIFNENLNAIIGSRSSGKSSLLSHIAYAVNPEETQAQQQAAGVSLGPAAGHDWDDIKEGFCRVNWSDGGSDGRVVYIPQNFLNKLSDDASRVTKYILPSVRAVNPGLYSDYLQVLDSVNNQNIEIETLVTRWFNELENRNDITNQLQAYGSEQAIESQIATIESKITELQTQSNITDKDSEDYRTVQSEISDLEQSNKIADEAERWLSNFISRNAETGQDELTENSVDVSINFSTGGLKIPDSLSSTIEQFQADAITEVKEKFRALAAGLLRDARNSSIESEEQKSLLESANKDLFLRFKANSSISKLEENLKSQKSHFSRRRSLQAQKEKSEKEMSSIVAQINSVINKREDAQNTFVTEFNDNVEGYGGLDFGVECEFDEESLSNLISKFDRTVKNQYIEGRGDTATLDIVEIQNHVNTVLEALGGGAIKIKRAENSRAVAQAILTCTRSLRFSASLDSDKIGGFSASTMTPGKQSLFALTLILSDAGDDWPLLIDQPEDDLDSRSIYKEIVQFLKKQKQRRQILMVTHNANLVVGADAECVIVANRHGIDRLNKDDRTFDYSSGALENYYGPDNNIEFELPKQGIREHVVDILDGGSEAFKKRQAKYKLPS